MDDGAKSLEDTLEMARVAADDGTKTMLVTPHRRDITENSSIPRLLELLDEMNGLIAGEGIGLTLAPGMENHLDLDLPEEIASGRAIPMNQSRYILVELPFFGRPNYAEDILFQIQAGGLTPVLAHPERIEAFQQDPDLLATLVERGMLSQVTAGSMEGHFGRRTRIFTDLLLRRGLVHIVSSDAHFAEGPRSPLLTPGVEAAAAIVGHDEAEAMVGETPKAVLENRPIEVPAPREETRPKRWWRFWGSS